MSTAAMLVAGIVVAVSVRSAASAAAVAASSSPPKSRYAAGKGTRCTLGRRGS
jgi:hypothetical protein